MDISLINSQSLLHLLGLTEKKEEILGILEQIDAEIVRTLRGGMVSVGVFEVAQAPAIVPPVPAASLQAKAPGKPAKRAKKSKSGKKSGMSPEGRAKMAAMMKARWAARRAGKPAVVAAKPAKAKKKKGGITPEGRARLAANMKARWAARKADKAGVPAKTPRTARKQA